MIGNTVTCKDTATTSNVQCAQSTAVVGSGVEFTLPSSVFFPDQLTEDFNANGLILTYTGGNRFAFNLTNIQNTDLTSPFSSFSVLGISGFSGLSASNISLTGGVLDIDLVGSTANNGDSITLGVSSVTPEPSSVMLLGTGLAAAAGASRRRFRRA